MRTRFEIVLADDLEPALLRAAGEEALREIERVESSLSVFRSDSDLYKINQQAAHQPVKVDARVFSFLQRALELCEQTSGAFDLAAGALAQCWNLSGMADGAEGRVPTPAEIDAAWARGDMRRNVQLIPETSEVCFLREGVRLDPGAIGKGYALERAAQLLREAGIRSALLHGGTSTVYGLGQPPNQAAWKVAVQHPRKPDALIATAMLRDTSLSVSTTAGKSFMFNGLRYGHVIDPRTGLPVQENTLAAVIHPSALLSDALSTAHLVSGLDGQQALTTCYPDASFLLGREVVSNEITLSLAGTADGRTFILL